MLVIAHGKGVILPEPCEKMNGNFFAKFIKKQFNTCFAKAGPKQGSKRLFVMDNDPSQSSKAAMTVWKCGRRVAKNSSPITGFKSDRKYISYRKVQLARRGYQQTHRN